MTAPESKKFATAINCIDGRVQEPALTYLRSNFDIDYVDVITELGPDKVLAEGAETYKIASIKQRIQISVQDHGSQIVLMAGHANCLGNPVEKDVHIAQTLNAAATIRQWFPDVEIIPVWIGDDWIVEPL